MSIARWRTGRVLMVDGLLTAALLVLAVGVAPHAGGDGPHRPLDLLAYLLIVLAVAPLAVRRLWPRVTLGVTVPATAAYLALQYPYGPVMLALFIAMFSVAARLPARRSLVACGLSVLVIVLAHMVRAFAFDAAVLTQLPAWVAGGSGILLVPWAVGTIVRLRREEVARAREEDARHGRDEERLRMAREVHDVVGHSLAVINMQSGVALHVLDRRPDQARPALEAIKRTSKESLDELRSTLAVFRQPEDREDAAESRRPTPSLRQLDGLVSAMADSGLPVDLAVRGGRADVPASIDLAGYRIVQESLTNVLKHAGSAQATVTVSYDQSEVLLEIIDDGSAPVNGVKPGGHGIPGMRERAAAVGGTLEAGPRAGGGFGVRARLPFGEGRR